MLPCVFIMRPLHCLYKEATLKSLVAKVAGDKLTVICGSYRVYVFACVISVALHSPLRSFSSPAPPSGAVERQEPYFRNAGY